MTWAETVPSVHWSVPCAQDIPSDALAELFAGNAGVALNEKAHAHGDRAVAVVVDGLTGSPDQLSQAGLPFNLLAGGVECSTL
jgi:hypothetical protein